jgi:hypothetical protein
MSLVLMNYALFAGGVILRFPFMVHPKPSPDLPACIRGLSRLPITKLDTFNPNPAKWRGPLISMG